MNPLYVSYALVSCYANDNDAFIPEVWAQMGLAILEENMVAANLVHRDFENQIAKFGDVVNTRRPGTFKVNRKKDGTTLTQQDATATPVQVPLDQWHYVSFTIKDGEGSKSFQDLVDVYLLPGMQTIARGIDRAVLGRVHNFLGSPTGRVGRLNHLDESNSKDYVLEAREILNKNKAYPNNRNLILAPASETALLKNTLFIKANERGDGGSALENATLGRILGFDTYMDQNVNSIAVGSADTDLTATVDNALAVGGSGSQAISSGVSGVTVGEFFVVNGNDQPTFITAKGGSTTSVTLNEANKYATGAAATTVRYKKCAVNHPTSGTYAAGWSETINVDGYSAGKAPQVGQLIAFNTGASRRTYTIIEATDNGSDADLILDRPLEVAVANDDAAFPGPSGSFNLALHREALALVTRPLALPNQRMGAMADVAVHNNVAMRVVMQYDIQNGGTVIALDILAGTAVLDPRLAVVVQG